MRTFTLLFAILCLAATTIDASAQMYGYQRYNDQDQPASLRPTVSPYLNLLNQPANADGSQRFNAIYQTTVRPQIEQRELQTMHSRETSRSHSDFQRFHNQIGLPSNAGAPRTGHGARFMSFSHYYKYPQLQQP